MDARRPDPFERLAGEVADGVQPKDIVQRASTECGAAERDALRVLAALRWRSRPSEPPSPERLLGAGASGRVHGAIDPVLERPIAIKTLAQGAFASRTQRDRFLAEARKLAQVEHPNVVRIHAVEESEGELRLQLERVEGRTLEQWVQDDGPLDAAEAARVGIELCRALAAIHAAGLVHCDLKPQNVMRERGGRIVVLDFGVARAVQSTTNPDPSPPGGTPLFMAPEQFLGSGAIGPRADLHALGVVLHWLVSGALPFEASSHAELRELVLAGKHVPLLDRRPDVPAGLAAVVERALAVEPGDRFASAGEMERALREWLVPATRRAPPRANRRWLVFGALALVIGGLALALRGGRATERPTWSCRLLVQRDGRVTELASGARISVGDSLRLELESAAPCHVYVFDEDSRGAFFALFPLNGFVPENPLAEGRTHVLPGSRAGTDAAWIVTSAGGDETLLVVWSLEPLEELDALRRRAATPSDVESGVAGVPLLSRDRGQVLRGIGGVQYANEDWASASGPPPGRLAEIAEECARRSSDHVDVRVFRLRCDS